MVIQQRAKGLPILAAPKLSCQMLLWIQPQQNTLCPFYSLLSLVNRLVTYRPVGVHQEKKCNNVTNALIVHTRRPLLTSLLVRAAKGTGQRVIRGEFQIFWIFWAYFGIPEKLNMWDERTCCGSGAILLFTGGWPPPTQGTVTFWKKLPQKFVNHQPRQTFGRKYCLIFEIPVMLPRRFLLF